MKKYQVLDLYAGTGRCSEPFREWRRTKGVALVDSNDYAKRTYLANFPGANYRKVDLSNTSTRELAALAGGKVDILLGCPPCQGFSDCGTKNADDPRNSHVSRMKNIIGDLKPLAVAMENVPLAAQSEKYDSLQMLLDDLGYESVATVANAAMWGSCQTRQRLIVVAIRKDVKVSPEIPAPTHGGLRQYFSYSTRKMQRLAGDPVAMLGRTPAARRVTELDSDEEALKKLIRQGTRTIPTVAEVWQGLPETGTPEAAALGHVKWDHSRTQLRRMGAVAEGGRWSGGEKHYSQTYGRLHRKGLSRTITAFFPNAGSGRFWHPVENRSITLREAARIQGFPDTFKFLDAATANCLLVGNALDKALSDMVFSAVKECLT